MGNTKLVASNTAIFSLLMVGRLIEVLAQKGILSESEGADVYRKAMQNVGEDSKADVRNVLKVILPDLKV